MKWLFVNHHHSLFALWVCVWSSPSTVDLAVVISQRTAQVCLDFDLNLVCSLISFVSYYEKNFQNSFQWDLLIWAGLADSATGCQNVQRIAPAASQHNFYDFINISLIICLDSCTTLFAKYFHGNNNLQQFVWLWCLIQPSSFCFYYCHTRLCTRVSLSINCN